MYTHPVWVPLLLCSTPGCSPTLLYLGATQLGATHYAAGQQGTEKRGGGGGGEEARTGIPCARKPDWAAPQASPAHGAVGLAATSENRQPLHKESGWAVSQVPAAHRQSGQVVRQLKAISPPPERRLLGNSKQPKPPLAAGTLFSGLFSMARATWAPTPRQGHRPRISLSVGCGVWAGGGGILELLRWGGLRQPPPPFPPWRWVIWAGLGSALKAPAVVAFRSVVRRPDGWVGGHPTPPPPLPVEVGHSWVPGFSEGLRWVNPSAPPSMWIRGPWSAAWAWGCGRPMTCQWGPSCAAFRHPDLEP